MVVVAVPSSSLSHFLSGIRKIYKRQGDVFSSSFNFFQCLEFLCLLDLKNTFNLHISGVLCGRESVVWVCFVGLEVVNLEGGVVVICMWFA